MDTLSSATSSDSAAQEAEFSGAEAQQAPAEEAVSSEGSVAAEGYLPDCSSPEYLRGLLNMVLAVACREKASDVYLKAGNPPYLRILGQMHPLECDVLTPAFTEALALDIMPNHMRAGFAHEKPEANFVYALEELGRFRVNAYRQRDTVALVMRRISDEIMDIETLGLPPVLRSLAMNKRGLVLVTGPTGSGKSTTLASMIRYRKEHAPGHIVTIEDPIEYVHSDAPGCLVSQREVGSDTACFKDALESALRQAPDVLLIGEMRDIASVEAAVYFAETGHLVLSTLHANNAVQTIERVLQFFPEDMHAPVLQQLSINIRGIVAQRLIPSTDGKRTVAVEVLVGNTRMQENIREMHLGNIKSELDSFATEGMQSFDHHLLQLVREGRITPEEAVRHSDNMNDMKLKLRHLRNEITSRGQS
ncbi:PilT/PilU family type 4a pilus ATPase [bacterium]|nr:PilT/PilU family type 4a pilus ATPase [bacterium]